MNKQDYFDRWTVEPPDYWERQVWRSYREPVPLRNTLTETIKIKESFRWLTPEFATKDPTKRTIKLKGVALKSDTVSRNSRKYIDEEVLKSARTLSGAPITINHDKQKIVGNVILADYEDGRLEYVGQVKKQPWVQMLREADPRIKGVSVEADYLKIKCVYCGQEFFSEEEFKEHMRAAHGIVNGITEVHGIRFTGLSLVVEPEVPGVSDTSFELMESYNGFNKLVEMVVKDKKRAEENVGVSKVGVATYTKEDLDTMRKKYGWPISVNNMVLGEGCRWKAQGFDSGEACVAAMTGKVDDPEAFCYGPTEAVKEQEEEPEEEVPECEEGHVYNPLTGACEPIPEVDAKIEEILKVATKKQMAKIYETIINFADKNVAAYRSAVKLLHSDINCLKERVTVLEKATNPTLKETAGLTTRIEKTETRLDNLEAKLRGTFKGVSKPMESKEEPAYGDPYARN